MWLGVLYDDDDEDEHWLLAYQPDRVFRMAGPLGGMAHAAVVWREAGHEYPDAVCRPRCPACAADLGVPDIDGAVRDACGSS